MKSRRNFLKHLLGLTAVSAVAQPILAAAQSVLAKTQNLFSKAHLKKAATDKARPVRMWEIERHMRETFRKRSIGVQFGGRVYNLDRAMIRFPLLGKSGYYGIDGATPADRNSKANIYLECVGAERLEADRRESKFLPARDPAKVEVIPFNLNRPLKEVLTEIFNYPRGTRLSLSGTVIVACDIDPWILKPRLYADGDPPKYFKEHPICYVRSGKTVQGLSSGSIMPNPADHLPDKVELGECEKLEMEGIWKVEVVSLPASFYVTDERDNFFLSVWKQRALFA